MNKSLELVEIVFAESEGEESGKTVRSLVEEIRSIITYKDRLSRAGFDLFYYLFQKYHCEIVVMSEIGSTKLDSQEIFEEIVSMLHCYSMKLYTKHRVKKIKEVLEETDEDCTTD